MKIKKSIINTPSNPPVNVALPNTTNEKMEAIVNLSKAVLELSKAISSINTHVSISNNVISGSETAISFTGESFP